jgi:hypothetical protein
VLAEYVDRGEDGAQAVGVVVEERGGLVDRLLVEGKPGGSRGQGPSAVKAARPRRRRTSGSGT